MSLKNNYIIVVGLRNFWWGVSVGRKHYTGEIIRPWESPVELTRKLSKREFKELSVVDGKLWGKPDTETNRFLSLAHLQRYAINWCIDNLGDEWLLQDYDCYGPYRPITCKGKIKRNFNALALLANRWESTPDSERSNKAIDLAWLEWKDLVNMD